MKKILFILFAAFLLRLLLLSVWTADGRAGHLSSDSRDYVALAESLSQGEGFRIAGDWVSRRPPLYPLFLAAFVSVPAFPVSVHLVQMGMGVLCCLFIFQLGRALWSDQAGLYGALFLSINYESIRQITNVMPEMLFVFFLLASLCLLFGGDRKKSALQIFAAGLASGLSLLTKDVLIFFYPCVLLWLLFAGNWRWKSAGLYGLGMVLVVLPWMLINAPHRGQPAVVTDRLGMTFYIANNPQATGGTGGQEWELGRDSFLPSEKEMAAVPEAQADAYYFRKGFQFIRESPGQFLALMGRKIFNMWRPTLSDSPAYAQWAMALTYIPLLIFGVAGMVLGLKRWKSLLPLYILLGYIFSLHAILIAHIRYRFAALPVLALFAGLAMAKLMEKGTSAREKSN